MGHCLRKESAISRKGARLWLEEPAPGPRGTHTSNVTRQSLRVLSVVSWQCATSDLSGLFSDIPSQPFMIPGHSRGSHLPPGAGHSVITVGLREGGWEAEILVQILARAPVSCASHLLPQLRSSLHTGLWTRGLDQGGSERVRVSGSLGNCSACHGHLKCCARFAGLPPESYPCTCR